MVAGLFEPCTALNMSVCNLSHDSISSSATFFRLLVVSDQVRVFFFVFRTRKFFSASSLRYPLTLKRSSDLFNLMVLVDRVAFRHKQTPTDTQPAHIPTVIVCLFYIHIFCVLAVAQYQFTTLVHNIVWH